MPVDSALAGQPFYLMVATSTPYVSYVRSWNAITGEEPVRQYKGVYPPVNNGNANTSMQVPATRISAGISPHAARICSHRELAGE